MVEGSVEIKGYDGEWKVSWDTLILDEKPTDSLEVKVRYKTLTEYKPVSYYRPVYESKFSSPDSSEPSRLSPPVSGNRLDVHGSKTFSLAIDEGGSTDLDQGLTINASGDLAGVEVDANVTDEEASFKPEGTTRPIEDFDRIFIGLTGEDWALELGDIDFSHSVAGYGTIERRLAGVTGNATLNKIETYGAFGIDGTNREYIQLDIEDGKKGPYIIGDRYSDQPVIPGSERVYLNGILLERGITEDYTVDYLSGELTFNNTTPVDAYSKVEVYYTYSNTDYRTDNQMASLQAGPLVIVFYREGSSRSHLFHTWSAEQQEILDTARGTQVILPGARMVGEGKGSYVLEDDHYSWVGFGSGNYDISFRYTGVGDYALEPDSGFFRYIGPDSGNYSPELEVSLPDRQEAAAVNFEEDFGDFGISLAGLGSRSTPNLYNHRNQDFGHSHKTRLSYSSDKLGFEFRHRLQAEHTWIPADGAETGTRDVWNLDTLPQAFNEQVFNLTWEPQDSFYTRLEGRHLWADSNRLRAGASVNTRWLALGGSWLTDRQRAYLNIRPRIGKFSPRTGFTFERFAEGTRNFDPLIGLTCYLVEELSVDAHLSRRIDQIKNTDWQDTLYYDRLGSSIDWQAKKITAFAAAGIERLIPVETDSGWQAVYANFNASWNPNTRIRFTGNYDQHLSASRFQIVEYRPVEPGTGDYTRDPETGEYVPAEEGDYELVTRYEEGTALQVERYGNLGTDINLKSLRFWSAFSYRNSSDAGSASASVRITLFPNLNELSIITSPQYLWQRLPVWGGSQELARVWGMDADIRSRLHPDYILRLVGSYDNENRTRDAADLRSREEWSVELAPILDIWLKLEPTLGFGTITASEPYYYPELDRIDIRKVWIGTDSEKRIKDWRVIAGVLLTARQSNVAADALPYLISRDDPAGFHPSWSAGLQRTFDNGLSVKALYEGNLYHDVSALTTEFELSAGMYF
ncbi:hypothetical protein GF359_05850 [candidate division WOR-3 bacterium]|uniref:Uncharacterized protein n=1 Tax=candidate division WOR-3 bacterium TaxID=2052148 RepID=A0A9D5QD62_UNCW3|nr:hypothetical protein [candidate division WOR-3 bacterium]MBD3364721.1 hypothetical protein [candidate division WOR-3 bacterium]